MLNSKSVVKTKNVLTEIKGSAIFLGPTMLLFTLLFLIPLVSEIFYSFTNKGRIDKVTAATATSQENNASLNKDIIAI